MFFNEKHYLCEQKNMKNLHFGYSVTFFCKCCIVCDGDVVYALAFTDYENNFNTQELITDVSTF